MLAAVGYGLFVAGGLIVASCSNYPDLFFCSSGLKRGLAILGSLFCGIGASGLWVSVIFLLSNKIAHSYYIQKISPPHLVGTYYGIFFSIHLGSNVSAGLCSAFLLQFGH
jgi:hypothetical protein